MKIVFLGTGGYHPTDLRQTACFMLPEMGIVLDAGTGMYRVRDWIETDRLDVFLSHCHLDHVVGLTFLLNVLYEKDVQHVTIHGAPDKLAVIQNHLFQESLFPLPLSHETRPFTNTVSLPNGGQLTPFELAHPGGCHGFRLDWPGQSIAYVTDTIADPHADYVKLIEGVDLLIHECYFADGWEALAARSGHSCTTPVAQVAAAADVGMLVLVHVNPLNGEHDPVDLPTAQSIFERTHLGVDGMEIDF